MDVQRRNFLALGAAGLGAAGLTAAGLNLAESASAAAAGSAATATAIAPGAATETMLLTGADADTTVAWDFLVTSGRNANVWKTIPTPSNWEFHGFGTYNYGPTLTPNENGQYRHTFTPPASWAGRRIFLVFEGSMTDTQAWINGTSAGVKHQGAFYRFRYDVTSLLKLGQSNLLEVTVNKDSSNTSVNQAEREADYWNFGGIFRPVLLEAYPTARVDRVAINAKASGSFAMDVFLAGSVAAGRVTAQLKRLDGTNVGTAVSVAVAAGATKASLSTTLAGALAWTAETPNLYLVEVVLTTSAGAQVHGITQRFGFRTIEVRVGDGVYLNGKKIRLKGCDRHTFYPTLGRASSPRIARMDILLMKEMNMNAVRMSHYPPDTYFLDLCDELGLYVLDELGGWHQHYDTTVGASLLQAMVTRDVNHPSILFWDNGNEGGWNTALDDDFAIWDVQGRKVLHPWAVHDGIDTAHYQTYDQTVTKLAASTVFMPTEFLHGLYDGGAGAGLNDYWKLMGTAPRAAGGFIWALVDEGVVRDDQGGAIDTAGNQAPDGILGPRREKEGSYYAIKEIWSPIQLANLSYYQTKFPVTFDGTVKIINQHDFINTKDCTFAWKLINYVAPSATATGHTVVAQGTVAGPDAAPGAGGSFALALPATWLDADALMVTATGPSGNEITTWVWTIKKATDYVKRLVVTTGPTAVTATETSTGITMTAGTTKVTIAKSSGRISAVSRNGTAVSLTNGPALAAGTSTLSAVTHSQDGAAHVVRATYTGDLQSVLWRLHPSGWLQVDYKYHLTGNRDFLGVNFDYPESKVKGVTFLGPGPYRVWKNRLRGVNTDVWSKAYNDTVTGSAGWVYPEFKGYHANMYWAALRTSEGTITMVSAQENVFLRLFTPKAWPTPRNAVATFPGGGLSFLDGISAIGNKFHVAADTGPEGKPNVGAGDYTHTVYFQFGA